MKSIFSKPSAFRKSISLLLALTIMMSMFSVLTVFAGEGPSSNLALNMPVSSGSSNNPNFSFSGSVNALINDGVVNASDSTMVATNRAGYAQIDLGEIVEIDYMHLWRYWNDSRTFYATVFVVSETVAGFSSGEGRTVLYNTCTDAGSADRGGDVHGFGVGKDIPVPESATGLKVNANGVKARYVRVYSNGSTANTYTHWAELMVYGWVLPTDKTALETLYNNVKDTVNNNYYDKLWNAFKTALGNAKSVLDDANARQSAIDDARSALSAAYTSLDYQELPLIPKPVSTVVADGTFTVDNATKIYVSVDQNDDLDGAKFAAEYLAGVMRPSTGFELPVVLPEVITTSSVIAGGIRLATIPKTSELAKDITYAVIGDEGYALKVSAEGVELTAYTDTGLFRGIQTIRQLLPPDIEKDELVKNVAWMMKYCSIYDYPRYGYRGIMLDICRHYHSPERVKRQIDLMSQFKMSVMHLHMTEDQGFRIASEKYPQLNTFGGFMSMRSTPGTPNYGQDPNYYTKEQFIDIIEYAAARHVDVIPEIEIPSHDSAQLFSLPLLNKDGILPQGSLSNIITGSVGYSITLDPNEDKYTHDFLVNIINEIAAMTKSEYIHIGGDEANSMSVSEYAAAVQPAIDAVHANGKKAIQWNQASAARNDFPFVDVMQNWETSEVNAGATALRALQNGTKILASIARRAYIDHPSNRSIPFFTMSWANSQGVSVHTGYLWDPEEAVPADYRDKGNVIGLEAPLWAENIGAAWAHDSTIYPRIMGYAEIGWSPKVDRITGRSGSPTTNDAAGLVAARSNAAYLDYENRIGIGNYNKRMYNQGIWFFNYPQLWDDKSLTVVGTTTNKTITASTPMNTPISGTIPWSKGANITEDDTISLLLGAEPTQGTVIFDQEGNWTYTPKEGFAGSDGFNILFSVDGYGIPVASNPTPGNSTNDRAQNAYAQINITVSRPEDTIITSNAELIATSSTNTRVAFNPPVPGLTAANFVIPGATTRVAYTLNNGSTYFLITTRRNETVSNSLATNVANYNINSISLPVTHNLQKIPVEYIDYESQYMLSSGAKIFAPAQAASIAEQLALKLRAASEFALPVVTEGEPTSDDIVLKLIAKDENLPKAYNYGMVDKNMKDIGDTGFRMYVDINEGVVLSAYTLEGLSFGANAIPQLIHNDLKINYAVMTDVEYLAAVTAAEDTATGLFTIGNVKAEPVNVLCILAKYDANEKLAAVSSESRMLAQNEGGTVNITVPYAEGEIVKAFIWNANTLKPLCAEATLN